MKNLLINFVIIVLPIIFFKLEFQVPDFLIILTQSGGSNNCIKYSYLTASLPCNMNMDIILIYKALNSAREFSFRLKKAEEIY